MSDQFRYDAGVYAVVSKKTGAMYVGATCFLKDRLATHVANILNNSFWHAGFERHGEQDIELRILERVEVKRGRGPRQGWRRDRSDKAGRDNLMERERHWIRKLRPSCNKHHNSPVIGVDIPVLEPEAVPA